MTAATFTPVTPSRDFTVAVFVVRGSSVLLHWHKKLQRWLPPGGHIEPNELPDEAAIREVLEETGISIRLVCDKPEIAAGLDEPIQLCQPAGIQLEAISPGHEHIDLIYFATPVDTNEPFDGAFLDAIERAALDLGVEIENWCRLATEAVSNQAHGL